MQVQEREIRYVVAMVWESMLQQSMEARDTPLSEAEKQFVSEVTIGGSWKGALCLAMTQSLATRAAAVMFGVADAEVTSRQRSDAVNELANMVGGNLKPMLGDRCILGIPRLNIAEGKVEIVDDALEYQPVTTLAFEADGQAVEVTLLKENDIVLDDWFSEPAAKAS